MQWLIFSHIQAMILEMRYSSIFPWFQLQKDQGPTVKYGSGKIPLLLYQTWPGISVWEPLRDLSKDRKTRKCGHLSQQLLAGRLVLPIHGAVGLRSASHTWKGIQHLGVWVHPLVPIVLLDVAAPECPTDTESAWPRVHTKHTLEELTPGCWTTFSRSGHDQKVAGVTGKAHPSHGLKWALKQGLWSAAYEAFSGKPPTIKMLHLMQMLVKHFSSN